MGKKTRQPSEGGTDTAAGGRGSCDQFFKNVWSELLAGYLPIGVRRDGRYEVGRYLLVTVEPVPKALGGYPNRSSKSGLT